MQGTCWLFENYKYFTMTFQFDIIVLYIMGPVVLKYIIPSPENDIMHSQWHSTLHFVLVYCDNG